MQVLLYEYVLFHAVRTAHISAVQDAKCEVPKVDISSPVKIADRRAELAEVTIPQEGSSSATQTSPTAVIPYIKSSQVSLVFPSVRTGDTRSLPSQSLYKHRTVLSVTCDD
jgi:hypothetical protein